MTKDYSDNPLLVLIEDHALLNKSLTLLFSEEGYRVKSFLNLTDARNYLVQIKTSDVLIVSDVRLPDGTGFQLLDEKIPFPIILMTAYGQIEEAVKAISLGAKDFILKPFSNNEIMARIGKVTASLHPDPEKEELEKLISEKFIGKSSQISKLYPLIIAAVRSDSTVLLTGESGTGKNLLARLIHDSGNRKNKPFQMVSCSTLPRTLIESELFGYEKGSFTGAQERKIGKLEFADGGTVFLDEIGELDRDVQVMLLRFLQDKSFERIGAHKPLHADVRIITATNLDPIRSLENGRLREDLFYRLNVVHVQIPPVREHPEDIELLFDHFNRFYAGKFQVPCKTFPKEMVNYSCTLKWAGNVREIENLMERIYALFPEQHISFADFLEVLQELHPAKPPSSKVPPGNLRETLEETEEQFIREALEKTGGNKSRAARMLGISRTALLHKIQKYSLDTNN